MTANLDLCPDCSKPTHATEATACGRCSACAIAYYGSIVVPCADCGAPCEAVVVPVRERCDLCARLPIPRFLAILGGIRGYEGKRAVAALTMGRDEGFDALGTIENLAFEKTVGGSRDLAIVATLDLVLDASARTSREIGSREFSDLVLVSIARGNARADAKLAEVAL